MAICLCRDSSTRPSIVRAESIGFLAAQPAINRKLQYQRAKFFRRRWNEVSGPTTVVSHQNSIGFDPKAIQHIVDEIKRHKGDLVLSAYDESSVDRDIEVIDAQLATQAPDRSKIKAALQSVKGIVEGGVKAGLQTAVTTGIIHLVGAVLATL